MSDTAMTWLEQQAARAAAPQRQGGMYAWEQLWVRAPEGNGYGTPGAMQRVDEEIQRHGALVVTGKSGLPLRGEDGTWEVRAYGDGGYVRFLLEQKYGLVVERTAGHAEEWG